MKPNNTIQPIDFGKVCRVLLSHTKTFAIVLPITFVLACGIILSVPRYYACSVMLAPESSLPNTGNLSSLASSIGLSSKLAESQDAIFPELYPDVMASTDFLIGVSKVKLETSEGVKTDYYHHLQKAKSPWWSVMMDKLKKLFKKEEPGAGDAKAIDPFQMTKQQWDVIDGVGNNISCKVNKKNDVITITVTDQDAKVAAILADSVEKRLQAFITDYRTKKARNDLDQVKSLLRDAKKKYEGARQKYGAFSDANTDVTLPSFRLKENDLENDMQLLFNNYSALVTRVQQTEARLQERTPAFTTIQSATVPVKPAGPKRMIFVLVCLILAFGVTAVWLLLKNGDDSPVAETEQEEEAEVDELFEATEEDVAAE